MNEVTMAKKKPRIERPALEEKLQEHFGLECFRDGQREIIETVLNGGSALVVMPTGGGKSLCYQLPAMLLPGLTLVVSPLIALMKDQVDALTDLGLPATFVNSTLSADQQQDRLALVERGEIKMLFVAPERFRSDLFWSALKDAEVSLVAVDEAHCISQWGHDFRPDYLMLGDARRKLGDPVTLGLTATATPRVRQDIRDQLEIPGAKTFLSGFERPNLFFEVFKAGGNHDKMQRLDALIRTMGCPAIVYCATRKQVEQVAQELSLRFPSVAPYHAGLPDSIRETVQDDFMDSEIDVLVATNAFGMGVDKADIRCIVHYSLPGSLEAYYQEAGRAGRDGEPAHCLLLYNYADKGIQEFFIEHSYPGEGTATSVWNAVKRCDSGRGTTVDDVHQDCRVHRFSLDSTLRLLTRAGHLRIEGRDDGVRKLDDARKLRVDWQEQAQQRAFEEERLKRMIFYATSKWCRNGDILRYFGSRTHERRGCGHCDVCVGTPDYGRVVPLFPSTRFTPAGFTPIGERRRIRCSDSIETLARKVLSCVARCRERETSRTVAQILVGSRATRLRRSNLNRLSTYGLLSELSRRDVELIIEVLVRAKLLRVSKDTLRLSSDAVKVMKGEEDLDASLHIKLCELVGES